MGCLYTYAYLQCDRFIGSGIGTLAAATKVIRRSGECLQTLASIMMQIGEPESVNKTHRKPKHNLWARIPLNLV